MSYEEKRVKVAKYGTTSARSPLLVAIPGTRGPLKLHCLAAAAFERLSAAIKRDLGIDVKAASAWRPHRWKSRQHYEETLVAKYGSVQAGRKWLAYNSPHETGLAVDFGVGGLEPVSKTAAKQRATPLHAWLVEHAHEYGWHPYKTEPWHWEYPVTTGAFRSGNADDRSDEPESALSFGDVEDLEDFIEELDADSVAWFSGEASEDHEDGEVARLPAAGGLTMPRRGEVEGEFEGGDGQAFRVRWRVRWQLG